MSIFNIIKYRICWLCDICLELRTVSFNQWLVEEDLILIEEPELLEDNIMEDS